MNRSVEHMHEIVRWSLAQGFLGFESFDRRISIEVDVVVRQHF